MSSVAYILRDMAARFRSAGLETPEADARLIMLHGAQLTLTDLIRMPDLALAPGILLRLDDLAARRLAGEPVSRLRGTKEFWGLPFTLAPDTLVPRPDSETLIEATLQAFSERRDGHLRVLDLGTGTGCLLLALLSEFRSAWGLGVDRSHEAVLTARQNAEALGLAERARFLVGDWADAVQGRFDIVISNPPYIPAADVDTLDVEVRQHDPRLALDGGEDGLEAYRLVVEAATGLLADDGLLVLELGIGQEQDVAGLARGAGLDVPGPAACDLNGIPRALKAYRKM